MKWLVLVLGMLVFGNGYSQYTAIPDAEFELRLVAQGIDTEGVVDGQVLTDDIDHITILAIDTPFPEIDPVINDLSGIEDFVALEHLNFASNNITSVDLSSNLNLKLLVCKSNNLTSLDLSNNPQLETLDAANCFLGTCDFENTFTTLDLSSNLLLNFIFLSNNNSLEELDLSNNAMLITAGISRNTVLSSLNLKNGNNSLLNNLTVLENSMLGCITVDDPVAATEGIMPPYDDWDVEEGVIFSKDCALGVNDYFLSSNTQFIPNPAKDIITIEIPPQVKIEDIVVLDLLGRTLLSQPNSSSILDLSSLSASTYWVRITTDRGTVTKRLIKE